MNNLTIKRLIEVIMERYPFLTEHEIIDFLIQQSLVEFDTVIENVKLPDPKLLHFKRNNRKENTEKRIL